MPYSQRQKPRSLLEQLERIAKSATSLRARMRTRLAGPLITSEPQLETVAPVAIERIVSAPDGLCIYAVGDIHGRLDLLEALESRIREDTARLPAGVKCQLVFLGDYIDRGLQSRNVIEYFLGGALDDLDPVFLMGNHEEALLNFLSNADFGSQWARFGGAETLFSYGFQPPNQRASLGSHEAMAAARDAWTRLWNEFRVRFPESHAEFFRSLKPYHIAGDYLFVHAGLRPGVDLSNQSLRDMLWIREEFLEHKAPFDRVIVHGHTPEEAVHHDGRRIGLDTGAFLSGKLSAARLFGTEVAFLST